MEQDHLKKNLGSFVSISLISDTSYVFLFDTILTMLFVTVPYVYCWSKLFCSTKMMPPKKSLAARTSTTSPVKNDDHVNGKDSEATVEKRKSEENMAPVPQRNIFTEKLVEGKRKRCIPVGQEMLNEW